MAAPASNCAEIAHFMPDQRFPVQSWVLVDQFCGVALAESGLRVGALCPPGGCCIFISGLTAFDLPDTAA